MRAFPKLPFVRAVVCALAALVCTPPEIARADIQTFTPTAISPEDAALVEAKLVAAQRSSLGTSPRIDASKPVLKARSGQLLSISATCGTPSAPVVCPQIAELARSLKNDPRLIYEYVLNNIEYIPQYGLLKGSTGAITNGAGSNFDIAQLTADLLNQAGYTATLVKGAVAVNSAAAASWLGINSTDVCGISDVFKNGGIPVSNVTACLAPGSFRLTQVWVKVVVGGTTYLLDPSVKQHPWIAGTANLAAITGYSRAAYIGAACGASACTQSQTVTGLNRATILDPAAVQSVPQFSAKLLKYMQDNGVHDVRAIVGGPSTNLTIVSALPTVLPYTPVGSQTDPFVITGTSKSALRVQFQGMDQYFSSDQIEGKRLTIFFDANHVPVLSLDGTTIASGTALPSGSATVTLSVCDPRPALGSDCSAINWAHPTTSPNQVLRQSLSATGSYLISSGWGRTNYGVVQYHQAQLAKALAAGLANASEPVLGEALAVLAGSWLGQTNLQTDLTLSLSGVKILALHQVGIVGQTTGPFVDLPGNIVVLTPIARLANGTVNLPATTTGFFDISMHSSVLESSAVDQMFNQSSVSTAKLVDMNMALSSNNSVFDLQICADLTAFKTVYVGWGARTSDITKMANDLCPATGPPLARYIVPQNGNLSEIPTGTPGWRGTGYYRTTWNGSSGSMGAIISGTGGVTSGGFSSANAPTSVIVPPLKTRTPTPRQNVPSVGNCTLGCQALGVINTISARISDPVDSSQGAYLYQSTLLKTGAGAFPMALEFGVQYGSSAITSAPSLGRGWSHSLDITAQKNSDGFGAFGGGDAWNMAEMIAEKFVSLDLLSENVATSALVPLKNLAVATVGHRWIGDRIIGNVLGVSSGGAVESFTRLADGTYNPPAKSTARVAPDATANWIYTSGDGSRFSFNTVDSTTASAQPIYRVATVAAPSGLAARFTYDATGHLLTSVKNSPGRTLALTWAGSTITQVRELYVGGALGRTVGFGYDANGNLSALTDTRGKSMLFCSDSVGRITSYFLPKLVAAGATCGGPIAPTIANTYDSLGRVKQQVDGDNHVTDLYLAGTRAEVVTHPGSAAIANVPDISNVTYLNGLGQVVAAISPRTGKFTTTTFDNIGRATRIVYPENNAAEVRYDERSNAVGNCLIAKPPVGQQAPPCNWAGAIGQIITSARFGEGTSNGGAFVFNCTNPATCNQPVATVDAANNETTYSYNANGTVSTITLPVPSGATVAPQTSFTYTNFAIGTESVSLLTGSTSRIDSATNTVSKTYTYDGANAFALKTVTLDPGGLALTTTYVADAQGNVISVKGPRTDVNDTVVTAFDAARNPTQVTYPNPGSGSPVTQYAYDDNGRLVSTAAKIGSNWSVSCRTYTNSGQVATAFGPFQQASATSCGFSSNAAVPLVQNQYDGADRLVRTSAVNTTETRTTRLDLLPDNLVGVVTRAEGTPVAQATATTTYSDNGLPQTTTNARGYPTLSSYDGFDRLVQTSYPNAAGTVSIIDVVAYAYDSRGLLTARTLRGTASCPTCISFAYDSLGRMTSKTVPAVGSAPAYTIYYKYDLVGQLQAAGTSTGTPELTYAYDKAGRVTAATQYGRALGYAYGPASQGFARTMTWPTAQTMLTCTDALGRTTKIKEAADCTTTTGQLVAYSYDDLSRRTSATNANGTASTLGYDPTAGALSSVALTFGSTASNVGFTMGRNRVQQVTNYAIDNALYQWTNHYNVSRPYQANALDQYTNINGVELGYDTRGNLNRDLIRTYTYDAENRLYAVGGSAAAAQFTYDPIGRLQQLVSGNYTQFIYDGDDLVAEYDGQTGALLARYVPGPTTDETVASYDGAGAKLWLHADPMGSVVAASDAAGATSTINEYGPWGEVGLTVPGHNAGRIRYTGQIYLPEVGLYHFKARAYAPLLGRFIQTDPIGAADDANLYAYVGNDPVNATDPTGLYADRATAYASNKGINLLNSVSKTNFQLGFDAAGYAGVGIRLGVSINYSAKTGQVGGAAYLGGGVGLGAYGSAAFSRAAYAPNRSASLDFNSNASLGPIGLSPSYNFRNLDKSGSSNGSGIEKQISIGRDSFDPKPKVLGLGLEADISATIHISKNLMYFGPIKD